MSIEINTKHTYIVSGKIVNVKVEQHCNNFINNQKKLYECRILNCKNLCFEKQWSKSNSYIRNIQRELLKLDTSYL